MDKEGTADISPSADSELHKQLSLKNYIEGLKQLVCYLI
jgi:hypothetical protein